MSQFKQKLKAEIRIPCLYHLINAYTISQMPRSAEQDNEAKIIFNQLILFTNKNRSLFIYTKAVCPLNLLQGVHNYLTMLHIWIIILFLSLRNL